MARKRRRVLPPPPKDLHILRLNGVEYYVDWKEMAVGASFFLPTVSTPVQVKASLQTAEQYLKIKFTVRARVEYGRYGARVWRVQ